MHKRILALAILAVVIAACSGSSSATNTPGSQATATEQPGGATQNPGGQTTPPNAADLKAKAQALLPSDATIVSEVTVGGAYQVTATSNKSIAELTTFWEQKIKDLGMNQTGKFEAGGALTIAFTNPNGGIVAGTDSSNNQTTIAISVGTSS